MMPPHMRISHDVPVGVLHGDGVFALVSHPLALLQLCFGWYDQSVLLHNVSGQAPLKIRLGTGVIRNISSLITYI